MTPNLRRQLIKVVIFVAAAGGTLAALLVLFGGAPDVFGSGAEYTVVFAEAPGVSDGTPVRRSGVRVGEVESVELDAETGLVRVLIKVVPKYAPRTKEDITIQRNLISGDATIDFVPKEGMEPPERLGDVVPVATELVGTAPPKARRLIAGAEKVLPSVQQSLDQIRVSVARFEKIAPRIEKTLDAFTDLARGVNRAVPEVRRTNDELRAALIGVRESLPSLQRGVRSFESLAKSGEDLAGDLRGLVRDNREAITEGVKSLSASAKQLEKLLSDENRERFTRTLESIASATEQVADLLSEDNRKLVERVLKNTAAATDRFPQLVERVDTLITEATKIAEGVKKTVPNVDAVVKKVGDVVHDVKRITAPLAEKAPAIVANVESATGQVDRAVADVREVIRVFARSDGTVQRLLTDPTLFNRINLAVARVTQLVPAVERILADAEVFADKIARHPERLGVGGAVRPSTGLKDAPNAPLPPARRRRLPGGR